MCLIRIYTRHSILSSKIMDAARLWMVNIIDLSPSLSPEGKCVRGARTPSLRAHYPGTELRYWRYENNH